MAKKLKRSIYNPPHISRSHTVVKSVVEAVKQCGLYDQARRLAGLTRKDFELELASNPQFAQDLELAKAEHAKTALSELGRMCRMTSDTKTLWSMAKATHPDLLVTPEATAKAKAMGSAVSVANQVNVNVFTDRLRNALARDLGLPEAGEPTE